MTIKRKITTIEEYDVAASGRSVLSRLLDRITGTTTRSEFYEHKEKRHYYQDGKTLMSLAFCNGTLYGGCVAADCVCPTAPFPTRRWPCSKTF